MAFFKVYNGFKNPENIKNEKDIKKFAKAFCDGTDDHMYYFAGCGCCDTEGSIEQLQEEIVRYNPKKVTVIYSSGIVHFFKYNDEKRKIFMAFIKGTEVEFNEVHLNI